MEKVRINNDLLVKYTVLRDGQPESFAGATDITVTVTNEAYKKAIPNTFDIVGNVVNISIDAADFNLCGKYRVTLKYVRGNDIEIDALAFEGVQHTELTGGTEIVGVEVVTVNISGDIGIAIPDNNKIDLDGLNSNIDKLHFKPDTLVQLAEIGDVRYSPESRTLEVKVSDTVSIQLGQEMQTRIKNDEAIQINNGQMVYIDSAVGANPLAKIASTSNSDIAQRTFGMATENIPSGGFGAITTEGLVRDINTSAFPEGAMLWLGTNGNVTNIEPTAPTSKISVGMVLRSNVANGVIYVKIRAISRNQKLSDVYAPTLTGGDILRWNSTTLRFETFNVTTALAGKADLVGGKIPTSQLPSYVDDVLEYANLAAFPATGETGKIYVALDTNLTYRWSGTAYVEISKSLALGETSSTAYRGDRGKTAYDHSQASGNPHGTTASQIPNTPAGTIAATTVQGAINELASDIVQVETDLNKSQTNKLIYDTCVVDTRSIYNLYDPSAVINGYYWRVGAWTSDIDAKTSGQIILSNGKMYCSQGVEFAGGYLYIWHVTNDGVATRQIAANYGPNSSIFFVANLPANYAYSQITFCDANPSNEVVQFSKDKSCLCEVIDNKSIPPFYMYGVDVNDYLISPDKIYYDKEIRSIYLEGASFADWKIGFKGDDSVSPGNGWFENACEELKLTPINKARSGSSIIDFARSIKNDSPLVFPAWNDLEFESFDILCIMHTHNYNVADESVLKTAYDETEPFLNCALKSTARVGYISTGITPEMYAQAYDYIFKEYAKKCYACKDNVNSRWYGTKHGKPVNIIVCTHWHDSRTVFNESIRLLQQKWGFQLVEFDKYIGFSKNSVNPSTGEQPSIMYSDNQIADTEVIDGVTYGWHQTRGKNEYIQRRMAKIFSTEVSKTLVKVQL